jgi:hypothetical protein
MIVLEELFQTVDMFRKYAPYVESNIQLKDLNSSAMSARKQIMILLSKQVYDEILITDNRQHEALCAAMANLTLAKQLIFDVINRRKSDIDIYKYELDAMRRAYIENYFNAMDTLIQLLNTSGQESAWKQSRYFKLLSGLKIQSAEEFDLLYPIDLSYLFFFRTISLQLEVIDEGMNSYFRLATGNEDAHKVLLRALAKMTVSLALRRFDILEFPATIRNLFEDSGSNRSGKDEQIRMLSLSDQLHYEAQELLKNITFILADNESGAIDTESSFNTPDDKIILMP